MRKDIKKCPKPLGYGIRRTPVVLGLSAALCMPAAFRMQMLIMEWIVNLFYLLCKEKQSKDKSWMKQESL